MAVLGCISWDVYEIIIFVYTEMQYGVCKLHWGETQRGAKCSYLGGV